MKLGDVLFWKFPGAAITVRYDPDPVIVDFSPGAKPTQAEIDQWTAEYDAWKAAEDARVAAIKNDARVVDMIDRLKNASIAQIEQFVDNQVTDLASARAMFKRVLAVMSAMLK